jgi:hypothetical protein
LEYLSLATREHLAFSLTLPSANVPPGLSDALDDVTAAKAPKTLNEAEVPEQQSGDNMTFSRANISALE